MDLVIRELSPALLDDYLAFFEGDAYSNNPDWSHCYCAFFHRDYLDEDPTPPTLAEENRAFRVEMIRSGNAPGLLAYSDGKVVGWCNAGPRMAYQNMRHRADAVEDPMEQVGSVMCFLISPAFRGRGIASRLLSAACEKFQRKGLAIAEGYPTIRLPQPPSEIWKSAWSYHGSLSMYLRAGFTLYREIGNWAVVRKRLGARPQVQ